MTKEENTINKKGIKVVNVSENEVDLKNDIPKIKKKVNDGKVNNDYKDEDILSKYDYLMKNKKSSNKRSEVHDLDIYMHDNISEVEEVEEKDLDMKDDNISLIEKEHEELIAIKEQLENKKKIKKKTEEKEEIVSQLNDKVSEKKEIKKDKKVEEKSVVEKNDKDLKKNSKKEDKVKKEKGKKPSLAYNIFKSLFFIFSLITSVILVACCIYVNLLPKKYIVIAVLLLVLVNAILSLLYLSKRKWVNIIGILFSIIFGSIFLVGYSYLDRTYNVLKEIVTVNESYTDYYVLTLTGDNISNTELLGGEVVGLLEHEEAGVRSEFDKKGITVTYKSYAIVGDLIYALQQGKVKAIIISEDMYNVVLEQYEYFEEIVNKVDDIKIQGSTQLINSDIEVGNSFILYISGVDSSYALSDVNILAVVNPTVHKVLLVNIPRDYYVQLHGTTGLKDKLTHAGLYGIDMSLNTVADLFDVKINGYLKVNFSALTNVVNAIDGVDVYSDLTFNSSHKKGWVVQKGWNHMNGIEALAFARERYAYQSGDRHRGQNQQAVITAIINKVSQNKKYLLKYADILESVEPYIATNVNMNNVQELVKDQLDTMPKWTVQSISVNGTNSSNYTRSFPSQYTYVMVPDQSTITSAKAQISKVFREG